MAITATTGAGTLVTGQAQDSDNDENGWMDIATGPLTDVHYVEIANADVDDDSYTKFYNSKKPVIGTTDPVMVLPTGASGNGLLIVAGAMGEVFSTGMSVASVKEAGTAGVTPLDSSVAVQVSYT
jgi:hypothetical protein